MNPLERVTVYISQVLTITNIPDFVAHYIKPVVIIQNGIMLFLNKRQYYRHLWTTLNFGAARLS